MSAECAQCETYLSGEEAVKCIWCRLYVHGGCLAGVTYDFKQESVVSGFICQDCNQDAA
jgi:hypothetical protein